MPTETPAAEITPGDTTAEFPILVELVKAEPVVREFVEEVGQIPRGARITRAGFSFIESEHFTPGLLYDWKEAKISPDPTRRHLHIRWEDSAFDPQSPYYRGTASAWPKMVVEFGSWDQVMRGRFFEDKPFARVLTSRTDLTPGSRKLAKPSECFPKDWFSGQGKNWELSLYGMDKITMLIRHGSIRT